MWFTWFDHPLIDAWLKRQLAGSQSTTSSADGEAPSATPQVLDRGDLDPLRSAVMAKANGFAVVN
jgi:hypothetical protein